LRAATKASPGRCAIRDRSRRCHRLPQPIYDYRGFQHRHLMAAEQLLGDLADAGGS
jgi:hypothetical protein